MIKLTVVVCSHNPRADHLARTLESLRSQTLPKNEWELLLIDNASHSPLAGTWELSWHPNGRHILEPELGLAAARVRGMKESVADLLVFADDDNVLDPSYLVRALEICNKWPILGAWGSGAIIPEFELEPADDLKSLMPYLALRKTAKACWSNVYLCPEATPRGAGLCVSAAVAKAYCRMNDKSAISISGRRGSSLFGGEDNEIAYLACDLGFGMGVFPELRLTHLIPKERVSRKYLLKLVEATEASAVLLGYKWKGILPRSPLHPIGILSIIKNSIMLQGVDRQAYFAYVRGSISARRIINAQTRCQTHYDV
jgi:glycosyltransferase involved in cell wall biosynthesis